jgi:hypothetical protein
MNNDDIVLPDTQVYEVKRTEDLALIGVEYTRKAANELLESYEAQWDEECYVAPSWIERPETIGQRNANGEA